MDLLLLQALGRKSKFNQLRNTVPAGMVAPDTNALLAWYGVYFQTYPEADTIDVNMLQSLIRLRTTTADPSSVAVTIALTEQLRQPAEEHAVAGMLGQLYELDMSGKAAALIERYQRGEEVELAYELAKLSQDTVRAKAQSSPLDYEDTAIEEILGEVQDDKGLKMRRWLCTRNHIAGLQPGASVAIAARPDKGKTSLIAALITDLAPQIMTMYPKGDRPILWLNNEGTAKRIIPRIYQAALGMTIDEIISLSNRGELVKAYTAIIGGVQNLVRVKDMHGANLAQVEQIIEAQKPAVAVADMLANVRGGGTIGGNKADEVEQKWQEWREMQVRQGSIGFATVQISAEGGNQAYPPYSALKDSKTGIQGATDIILMLGSLDAAEAQAARWLSSPKNKFAMPGKPSCFQADLYFDASKSIFTDGQGGGDVPQTTVSPDVQTK